MEKITEGGEEVLSNDEIENEGAQNVLSIELLAVLKSMKESMSANNVLLQNLVDKSESPPPKRGRLSTKVIASEKANHTASEKANSMASEEAITAIENATTAQRADSDVLSLFAEDSGSENGFDSDEEGDNETLLDEINSSLNATDDTSPQVSEKLASLVNDKYSTEYSVEKRKEISERYKRPKNCEALQYPRVNEEMWGGLPPHAKRADIKMSALQANLISVSSAIIMTVEDLLNHREKKTAPNYKTLIPRLTDSLALLGQVNQEISYKRKDAMRPFLSNEFKQACSRSHPPGKFLFGDDLAKTLQDVRTTNKIMSSSTKQRDRNKPYQRSYTSGQKRSYQNNSFLRKEGRGSYPPRSQNQAQSGKKRFTKN